MRIVAFDSKRVLRRRSPLIVRKQSKLIEVPKSDFKALLGIGVTITDYKTFAYKYNQVIDVLLHN
ncbi:MAG: hypothetical protein AABX33_04645 [Nanoarchaeota archaeon]